MTKGKEFKMELTFFKMINDNLIKESPEERGNHDKERKT
jgi:hypothetical protein